ncbi:hypothetical protein tinsulaeT_15640 [Thalassotalea insulae]|uniref:Uncharacterized protein n=1 Tax=Thalassotalea insulae TaxID=2056778 RepID=A0ABQ6GRH6_9GAMM|nr:hypothetical protein [Thalassotalea insulae]GLX78224.1 hypothetical protein tinsulaeT_15640 [Thalassotalea insulae]
MKNLLILIVVIALFLHFYPQPEVTDWYEQQKSALLEAFSDATDTKVRLNPAKIYRDLEAKFEQFNEDEQGFIKEITSSREQIKDFFNKYCNSKKNHSPVLHHTNQKVVCDAISPYQSLF